MSFDQYSETPASNYITGYFLTGMAPSSVKVAGSDIMADLASRFAAMHTSTGTATAFVVIQTRQWASLVNGLEIIWLPNATNTGAATLAVDGLSAKNLYANGVAATVGMVANGVPCHCKYDGTQFNILNPQRGTGSFTITLATGLTTTPTGTINYAIEPTGKPVYIWANSAITGTSNATTMTGTGIPSVITPTTTKRVYIYLEDNGGLPTTGVGFLITGTSSTWTFSANFGTGGFTSSGNKGIPAAGQTSYTLD
jgi:hypothetical protein